VQAHVNEELPVPDAGQQCGRGALSLSVLIACARLPCMPAAPRCWCASAEAAARLRRRLPAGLLAPGPPGASACSGQLQVLPCCGCCLRVMACCLLLALLQLRPSSGRDALRCQELHSRSRTLVRGPAWRPSCLLPIASLRPLLGSPAAAGRRPGLLPLLWPVMGGPGAAQPAAGGSGGPVGLRRLDCFGYWAVTCRPKSEGAPYSLVTLLCFLAYLCAGGGAFSGRCGGRQRARRPGASAPRPHLVPQELGVHLRGGSGRR
jgi:hypothetical protein